MIKMSQDGVAFRDGTYSYTILSIPEGTIEFKYTMHEILHFY